MDSNNRSDTLFILWGENFEDGENGWSLDSGWELTEIDSKTDSSGTYSLEYLNSIIKAVGTTVETVTCVFSSAKPLRIEFKVANLGRIHFYLAPRVES